MAKEIERKFLVRGDDWKKTGSALYCCQGYLSLDPRRTVRVRIMGDEAFLTIKGPSTGATRDEYEYPIPTADAAAMLGTLAEQPVIEKNRYRILYQGMVWEVDEFLGANAGLVVAEVELTGEDQAFAKPDWVGDEVTGDPRYYNSGLVKNPFSAWG